MDFDLDYMYSELLVSHSILSNECEESPSYIRAENDVAYVMIYFDDNGNPEEARLGCNCDESFKINTLKENFTDYSDSTSTELLVSLDNYNFFDNIRIKSYEDRKTKKPFIEIFSKPEYMTENTKNVFCSILDSLGADILHVEDIMPIAQRHFPDSYLDLFSQIKNEYNESNITMNWNLINYEHIKDLKNIFHNQFISLTLQSFGNENNFSVIVRPRIKTGADEKTFVKEDFDLALSTMLEHCKKANNDWQLYDPTDDPRNVK